MKNIFLIGIGGGTCSGKTTLTRALAERLGSCNVAVLHTDTFFRPGSPTHNRPECIDEDRLRAAIHTLRQGEPAQVPARGNRPASVIEPRPITLVEGHLCLTFPWLLDLLDLSIYVDMDDEERVLRRIERNVAGSGQDVRNVIAWYRQDVLHNHRQFTAPTKSAADIILWGEWTERRLSRVVQLIKSLAKVSS